METGSIRRVLGWGDEDAHRRGIIRLDDGSGDRAVMGRMDDIWEALVHH